MNIIHQIRYCSRFTLTEHQLAEYVLHHRETVAHMSMKALMDATFVSKSMIHRFCKKLGLNGFNELRIQLMECKETTDSIGIDINYPFSGEDSQRVIAEKLMLLYEKTIRDTHNFLNLDSLLDIVMVLEKALCIDIYTHAHNFNAAENFQDKMLSIGRQVTCQDDDYKQRRQALMADRNHVAVILSYSGRATFIKRLIPIVKKQHTPILWIGRMGNEEMAEQSDYQLYLSDSNFAVVKRSINS